MHLQPKPMPRVYDRLIYTLLRKLLLARQRGDEDLRRSLPLSFPRRCAERHHGGFCAGLTMMAAQPVQPSWRSP